MRRADQPAYLAAHERPGCRRRQYRAAVEALPYRLAIEGRIDPDKHEGQRHQGVNPGREADRDKIAEFHISDENSKNKDLHHRPRTQLFGNREKAAKMAGRYRLLRAYEHVNQCDQAAERRHDGDENDHRAQHGHIVLNQFLRPRKQTRDPRDAGLLDGHQIRRAHHNQQHESGKRQRDDMLGPMRGIVPEHRRAAQAACRHARHQRRYCLDEAAAGAFAQLGRRRPRLRDAADHLPAANIAASPSASCPTAALIAVTSPGVPVPDGGTTMRKLRRTDDLRLLKLTFACASRIRIAARILVKPANIDLDHRVGRGGDRAGLVDDRALRQPLGQFLGQNAAQHRAQRFAPPVVVLHIEATGFGRFDDLRAVQVSRQPDRLHDDDRRRAGLRLTLDRCDRVQCRWGRGTGGKHDEPAARRPRGGDA